MERPELWREKTRGGQRIRDGDHRKAHSTPLIVDSARRPAATAQRRREGRIRLRPAHGQGIMANRIRRLFRCSAARLSGRHRLHGHRHHAPRAVGDPRGRRHREPQRQRQRLVATQVAGGQNGVADARRRPDLHGQRRRHHQLHRRRNRRGRVAKTHRRCVRRIANLRRTVAFTSATRTARRLSSSRAASSKSWPPTRSTTAAWRRRPSMARRFCLRTKTHLYRIESGTVTVNDVHGPTTL